MEELRILSPLGMLGYGFPLDSFKEGLRRDPHAIVADAGSTDAGPHKLGAGVGIVSRAATKKDLYEMLRGGHDHHIPVLVGSAGGSGARKHVEWTLDIVQEIIRENHWKMRVGVIYADIDKQYLAEKLHKGKVTPLGPVPTLTEDDIFQSARIVAQMGHEPFVQLLDEGVDVIIGGRSYDPAMTAAVCVKYGFDKGLAYHMGKILECGAQCAIPGSPKDCMMGYLHKDNFVLTPMNSIRKCTTYSVAAHTLYEKTNPMILPGPGGVLDLSGCKFEQFDERSVRISGSKFIPDEIYRLKLEGSRQVGYRTFFIAGIRDPHAIECIDEIVAYTVGETQKYFSEIPTSDYTIDIKIYGKNGVMGSLEPQKEITSHELCIVDDVVAKDQAIADQICAFSRSTMLHYHYTGRYATAGNLAFPFSPSDVKFGPVYKFSVYHLLAVDNTEELDKLLPREILEIG